MLECLTRAARAALQERGGNLVIARGTPERELPKLAREHGATAVYFASDASPFAMRARQAGRGGAARGGRRAAPHARQLRRRHRQAEAVRGLHAVLARLEGAAAARDPRRAAQGPGARRTCASGEIPSLSARARQDVPTAARRRDRRPQAHARLAARRDRHYDDAPRPARRRHLACSRPYLHFGCVSRARARGARRTPRRLHPPARLARLLRPRAPAPPRTTPSTPTAASSTRIEWDGTDEHFDAWREGRTGYPVVDAGMRQLAATGWMHNRARLITACFLVKDLHIDWRRGEQHFMRLLLDGDEANNNGNWQWISSVGVDPAPLHRRLYNPMLQQQRHDPDGAYVRRWVPELEDIPLEKLATPWEAGGAGADRRPRRRAPAHAGGLRRPRARKLPPQWRTSRSSPAGRSRSPPRRASSPAGRPGRARSTTTRSGCDFLVDDWSGPAHVVLRQDGERRPRDRRGRQRASARSRRRRGSSRSTTTAAAIPRSASATRSSASCSAPAATCARCSSTRPTRRRRGR